MYEDVLLPVLQVYLETKEVFYLTFFSIFFTIANICEYHNRFIHYFFVIQVKNHYYSMDHIL
jgi:hypothetical protein